MNVGINRFVCIELSPRSKRRGSGLSIGQGGRFLIGRIKERGETLRRIMGGLKTERNIKKGEKEICKNINHEEETPKNRGNIKIRNGLEFT